MNRCPSSSRQFDLASYGVGTRLKMLKHFNGMLLLGVPMISQASRRSRTIRAFSFRRLGRILMTGPSHANRFRGSRPASGLLRACCSCSLRAALWPAPAAAWWNDEWPLRKKITIDTGASGANITDPIGTTPVLVRLHVGNFRFGQAKEDGGDLRFVAARRQDAAQAPHREIRLAARRGAGLGQRADLQPGAKTDIWLYYGNTKACDRGDAKGTYDPDTLLVYHFAERGTPAQDSSAWANSAQSVGQPAPMAPSSARARASTARPRSTLPGSPSLVVAEGGD